MNVGQDKGRIVVDLIDEVKRQVMVELGGYVGYSCILFGNAARNAGGKRYFGLERNPEFAAVLASPVDLAGLSDIVRVIVDPNDKSIKKLHASGTIQHIDDQSDVSGPLQAGQHDRSQVVRGAWFGHARVSYGS